MERRFLLKSTIQLGGVAVMMGPTISLLQSCKEVSKESDWALFFDSNELTIISSLIDTVLPSSDTPGGLDVQVDVFVDQFYASQLEGESKSGIKQQIVEFNEGSKKSYGDEFVNLTEEKRLAYLKDLEDEAPKILEQVWGAPVGEQEPLGFYKSFKSMILWAYCTSEEIATTVLKYDPIPQGYNGCIPLSEVGGVWSM